MVLKIKIKFKIHNLGLLILLQSIIFNTHAKESTLSSPKINHKFINSDWVNQQKEFSACPGYYKLPLIPTISAPEISADSSSLAKNGLSKLNGNIEYLDKNQKVSADKATAYRDEKLKKISKITLQDNVEFLSPNFRALTSKASADLLTNTAILDSDIYFRYYPNNAHGTAKKAVIIKDSSYNIFDAMYTTCPPSQKINPWQLNASDIYIDPKEEVGSAWNTMLYFYNFPVFYTPYISFPTSKKRKSGFLLPIYNNSDRYGYSIALPYYLNLAPNYDATITPRYMTVRDTQIQIETRYLDRYGNNLINFEFLPDDKNFAQFRKENLANPPDGLTRNNPKIKNLKNATPVRFAVKFKDNRQWGSNISSAIDYNYFSDNQYIIDLPPSEILRKKADDHLIQQAVVNYNSDTWQASALIKGYQTLHTLKGPALTEPYKILPGITLNNNSLITTPLSFYNINPILNISVDSHAMHFVKPLHPAVNKIANGQRYFIKPIMSLPVKKTYGYINPKVALHSRVYNLNALNENAETLHYRRQQDYIIPILSLDSGLYFDRPYHFNNQEYNQTLEPRLFYLFVPNKKQHQAPDFDIKESTLTYEQLFRDNRYSGYDRQSNANQLSAGLVSRFQNISSGSQYLKLTLGQTLYFQNMITTICDENTTPGCIKTELPDYKHRASPFVTELNINFDPKIYGQAEWQWDYYLNKTRKANLGLHYIDKPLITAAQQTLVNIEYNFLKEGNIQYNTDATRLFPVNNQRNNLSEIETSFKLPVHNNWNILGFTSYDLTDQSTLDNYLGAEFQQCCWAVRLGYRNQLRLRANSQAKKKYDNIYTIQFSLKGLGELNQSFENILKNNIHGYYNNLSAIY